MSGRDLESSYLQQCMDDEVRVIFFHGNGAYTRGYIIDFDEKVIVVNEMWKSQLTGEEKPSSMVYRSAVTNIVPD